MYEERGGAGTGIGSTILPPATVLLLYDKAGTLIVSAHGFEREIAEKCIRISFTCRTWNIRELEELSDRGRNAGVLERFVNDRTSGNPGGDEDGGNPDAKAIE